MKLSLEPPRVFALHLVAAAGAVGLNAAAVAQDLEAPFALAEQGYVQPATFQGYHPNRFETWHHTLHRTMTQAASPDSVLRDFEDAAYRYQGVNSLFTRQGERYFIGTPNLEGQLERFEVAITVGSRRVQQYVTRLGDRSVRLPLAWNIEEGRWFHLNGGFLHPDGSDFNTHTALWDANCIFCHNVKARPGYDWDGQVFDSRVDDVGIACEACHGPAAAHIARNANPVRRYLLYLTGRDPTIVSPEELDPEPQVQVCGHCHGQRLPEPLDRIEQFLAAGDPYTPGDDLNDYTRPIFQDSHLEGLDLSLRFWRDGTPRLTAYEYQALLQTTDYQEGGLTCLHCHNMHGEDPRGMIEAEMRGPQACLQCHEELASQISEHSRHEADSPGSDCYACHIPKITYGLLDVHPTHRISNPDPAGAWRDEIPEACTLCHTNHTARWAATALSEQYGLPLPEDLPGGPPFDMAENVRALLGRDVVQRAVAVMALADEYSYTADSHARLWAVPFLLLAMEDDYPAIRHFAYRGLRSLVGRAAEGNPDLARGLEGLPEFDPQAAPASRLAGLAAWWGWWLGMDKAGISHPGPAVPLDKGLQPRMDRIQPLLEAQDDLIILIGE